LGGGVGKIEPGGGGGEILPAIEHAPCVIEYNTGERIIHQSVHGKVTGKSILLPGITPQQPLLIAGQLSQLHLLQKSTNDQPAKMKCAASFVARKAQAKDSQREKICRPAVLENRKDSSLVKVLV
jgi:hypothetical protein